MGDVVLPLRCLSLRAGSALSYAPLENATAPGQASLDTLKNLWKADQISRKTYVYGVIGNPIAHSLSPQLQNAGFQARKMDAVYFPFLVHDLRDFLGAVKALGIRGFSVTLPYKQEILRYLDSCDPLASAIGAVNTVVVTLCRKSLRVQYGLRGGASQPPRTRYSFSEPRIDFRGRRRGASRGLCTGAVWRLGLHLCEAAEGGKETRASGRRTRVSAFPVEERIF